MSISASPELARSLARFNQIRLTPGLVVEQHPHELGFVEACRAEVASAIPKEPSVQWCLDLLAVGPGQGDPLYTFLAERATLDQLTWFLLQEAAGEAGFDDLLALTQVKMPLRPKVEMARNYWDELGQGKPHEVHGELLRIVTNHFGLRPEIETTVWESLRLANLMTAMAVHRRYAYQSVGALGVIEMTAPGRVALVAKGMERLGVPKGVRKYFAIHATLDIQHSREWNREILEPLADCPTRLRAMAEGAYLRLWAGAACIRRYRREFGLDSPSNGAAPSGEPGAWRGALI